MNFRFSSTDGTSGPAEAEAEPAPGSPRVDVATLSVAAAAPGDPRAAFVAKVDGWLAAIPIGGGGARRFDSTALVAFGWARRLQHAPVEEVRTAEPPHSTLVRPEGAGA